jgi:hypothetical protein
MYAQGQYDPAAMQQQAPAAVPLGMPMQRSALVQALIGNSSPTGMGGGMPTAGATGMPFQLAQMMAAQRQQSGVNPYTYGQTSNGTAGGVGQSTDSAGNMLV